MPVLIDGNNLLFAVRNATPQRPASRPTLCLHLGQWARRTRQKVTVVFDGPKPSRQRAQQIGAPGIAVSFSGSGVSADDIIIALINSDSAPRRLVVVSSDRQVMRAARRRRAQAIGAAEFWSRLERDLARPRPRRLEPPEKRRGLRADEADRWMRELGMDEG